LGEGQIRADRYAFAERSESAERQQILAPYQSPWIFSGVRGAMEFIRLLEQLRALWLREVRWEHAVEVLRLYRAARVGISPKF
jgi:hypothetical protein